MISMADSKINEQKEEHLESKTKSCQPGKRLQKWKEHQECARKPCRN